MKVGLYGNLKRSDVVSALVELANDLKNASFDVVRFVETTEIDVVDVLFVIGGDGTIIPAAGFAAKKHIPVVGVNYGTVGFLAQFEKDETAALVEFLKELELGGYSTIKRTVLQAKLQEETYFALNEIALQRDYTDLDSQIMVTNVVLDGGEPLCIRGDGVLISTPTGSTAYSLSAGGAILSPTVAAIMLTPVCSFSLNARPLVVPDDSAAVLSVAASRAVVLVDGREMLPFKKGDVLVVSKAPFTADFPVRKGADFIKTVSKKLK